MEYISGVPVWGRPVDQGALKQITNCARGAAHVALMADHHKGYAVPIGGVVAYEGKISPSGVGFDIACLSGDSRVSTGDGYWLPIPQVTAASRLTCWDGLQDRPVAPHCGCVAKGVRDTLAVRLDNGRVLRATADHLLLTRDGWKAAGLLTPADRVGCRPFVGLPFRDPAERPQRSDAPVETVIREALLPLLSADKLAPLVRLLGAVNGDGHITRDGKRLSVYTTDARDAEAMLADFGRLGHAGAVYRRERRPGYRTEHHVCVNSKSLVALFTLLGSPVGRKDWPAQPMPWLFAMPAWVRAQYLSAFFSAEGMTPRPQKTTIPNLQLKQAGENDHSIGFVGRLLESLCFQVSTARSGKTRGTRFDSVLQILGGLPEQVRFFEEVGFCYAHGKRVRAAQVSSIAWQHLAHTGLREQARAEARRRHQGGDYWKDVKQGVAAEYGVSPGFVHHAIYDDRGGLRRERGAVFLPDTTDEVCWVPVRSVTPEGDCAVFDVVTGDPAHCFYAEGVVAHNCGNKAVRLDIPSGEVRGKIKQIMDAVWSHLEFGIGRNNPAPVEHELFDDEIWKMNPVKTMKQMARNQLGTIGSGNHYVDLFIDELDRVWVGAHFGSRGLGHRTATFFLETGGAKDGMDVDPLVLDVHSPLGEDYLTCMTLAGRYAYAGRDWVCAEVARMLGAEILEEVHNHHNFAWKEQHEGRDLWVVRKGATPAFPGQKGFVGGSMGDKSVILEGVEAEEAKEALYSTVHGAGRVMSRTAARGKINRRTGQVISPGAVSRQMMNDWIRAQGVELRGAGTDEAPQCYKRLPEVLEFHKNSIRVLHTLTPVGVAMAGENEVDPYKD